MIMTNQTVFLNRLWDKALPLIGFDYEDGQNVIPIPNQTIYNVKPFDSEYTVGKVDLPKAQGVRVYARTSDFGGWQLDPDAESNNKFKVDLTI